LIFIATSLVDQATILGRYLEVGCAHGVATAFVNRALTGRGRPAAIAGWIRSLTLSNAQISTRSRRKDRAIGDAFTHNDIPWVRKLLAVAEVDGVELI